MKKLLIALMFICCSAYGEPTAEDANQIHAAISGMFTALQKGDNQALFDLQTADTKQMFGSADDFAKVLEECCNALRMTAEAKIVGVDVKSDSEVSIAVLLVDKRNLLWGAVFVMQKESGAWKVDQCHIKLIENKTNKKPEIET